jgi:tetratricopeptide (TPR) repeat protein
MAQRALERFERIGDPTGAGQALRILAAAAVANGDPAAAEERFARALRIAAEHDDALLRADVQRDRGLFLRGAGRIEDARSALAEAAESFEQIGSAAEAEAIRVILADLPAEG